MDMRLAYVGCKLDRAAHLRVNEDSLCERLRQPSTRILPVWRDRNLVTSDNPPRVRALSGRLGEAAILLAREIVFLGLEENGPAWFACDLSHHEEGRLASLADGGFEDLAQVVTRMSADEAALLAYAPLDHSLAPAASLLRRLRQPDHGQPRRTRAHMRGSSLQIAAVSAS